MKSLYESLINKNFLSGDFFEKSTIMYMKAINLLGMYVTRLDTKRSFGFVSLRTKEFGVSKRNYTCVLVTSVHFVSSHLRFENHLDNRKLQKIL